MVLFNYSTKELTAKIVYYGPGLCGKTSNLQFIHSQLPDDVRGKMLSLATKTDRTLFFDFLPIDVGSIRGMKTRVQLYTVPGQVFYNETRRLVLKGADGIVFVADSQEQMLQANAESFRNLEDNLKAHGMNLADMPHVIQFNKRDLPKISSIEDLNGALNKYNAPFYESVATTGIGVQDSLKAIAKLVLLHLTNKYDPSTRGQQAPRPAAAAPARQAPAPTTRPLAPTPNPAPAPMAADPQQAGAPMRSVPLSDFTPAQPVAVTPPAPAAAETMTFPPAEPTQTQPVESMRPTPPPPPNFRGASQAAADPTPVQLGESDIEDLVHEVGEAEALPFAVAPEPEPEPFAIDAEPFAADPLPAEAVPLASDPIPGDATFETPDADFAALDAAVSAAADEAASLEAQAKEPGGGGPDPFQVDQDFDPEFPQEIPVTSEAAFGAEPAGPPVSEASVPEEPVILTDEASDLDMFDDPYVDVARMQPGQQTEVVVPVELGSGGEARRFKLSIHLRLDPVD